MGAQILTGKPTDPLDCSVYLCGSDGAPIGFVRKDGSVFVRRPEGIVKATADEAIAIYVRVSKELGWLEGNPVVSGRIDPGTYIPKPLAKETPE